MIQRDGPNASTVLSKRRLGAENVVLCECGGRGGSRVYRPLQCGRTPESSLNGGQLAERAMSELLLNRDSPRWGGRKVKRQ